MKENPNIAIARSPIKSRLMWIAAIVAYHVYLNIKLPFAVQLWLLQYAGIYAHSESLDDWRHRWLHPEPPVFPPQAP